MQVKSIQWKEDHLLLLDQRKLPKQTIYFKIQTLQEVIQAIKNMVVRGAPAIAIAGMYGLVLYLKSLKQKPSWNEVLLQLENLKESRPTAVNLRLSIEKFLHVFETQWENLSYLELTNQVEKFAIEEENIDIQTNLKISQNGTNLFGNPKTLNLITYCNTGAIATAGIGTALGIIRELHKRNFFVTVYVLETRPYHQGSRLTTWELMEENIPCYLLCDNMAAWLMQHKKIDAVIVGADRIAMNGDTANKIGTYSLSISALAHNVPFFVAASQTSFDFTIESGNLIQIEMRSEEEITRNSFIRNENNEIIYSEGILAPIGVKVLNPAFDVTPAQNITAIITEKGIIQPVNKETIQKTIT